MKTRWLWVAAAGIAVVAAAAALVAGFAASSGPAAQKMNKFAKGESLKDFPGVDAGAAEAEAYAQRAYPADEVTAEASAGARSAWAAVKSRGVGKGKNKVGQWALIGPSSSRMPGILVFSGSDYTTSGRVTGLALDPACSQSKCRVWVAAAGGGIWRTKNGLSGSPSWEFVSGSFNTNAIGTLTYDANSDTLYAGTGEQNSSADSEAGLGLYKSTDGGDTWTLLPALTTTAISGPYTGNAFKDRGMNAVVVDPTNPNVIWAGSGSAVRGICSVSNGCDAGPLAPLPARGIYKSTDGGLTFTNLNGGTLPFVLRGVTDLKLDPTDHNTVYAAQYGQGIYRSTNAGATWTQIFAPINPGNPSVIERYSLALQPLPNGKTRAYLGVGDNGTFAARFYRTDDAKAVTSATWTNMTTAENQGYCTAQCWYDNVVYSPPGQVDTVYLGGAYDYPHAPTYAITGPNGDGDDYDNGRAFIMSKDGGQHFTDVTRDSTSDSKPNGMHPDSHAIATVPGTDITFFGSDGGVVRTSGDFADISYQCDSRNLNPANLALCKQLLSRVPTEIRGLNRELSTLQFQSLSVNPQDAADLMGGTQDNGTWEPRGHSAINWDMIIWGDGGQSGFNAANPTYRFNTFTGQANDANFRDGDYTKWVVITGDIVSSPEGSYFYAPVTADPNPAVAGTIYQGSYSVWRTQDWGGDPAYLEANCPEFFTSSGATNCGDFEPIGPPGHTNLRANDPLYGGADRSGTFVAAIERAPQNTGTVWAATGAGRVFVSHNANDPAASVTWRRIDNLPGATADPARFVSSIYIDPANANHAWISYSGYNGNTPTTPGHVFEVTYNPVAGTATWTNLDGNTGPMGDLPSTDLVRDDVTGDLYGSTDFGVMRLEGGNPANGWTLAAAGLPNVEVAGLTIVPSARKLYAATHGRSAWVTTLP
jgi:hypothetical protein